MRAGDRHEALKAELVEHHIKLRDSLEGKGKGERGVHVGVCWELAQAIGDICINKTKKINITHQISFFLVNFLICIRNV